MFLRHRFHYLISMIKHIQGLTISHALACKFLLLNSEHLDWEFALVIVATPANSLIYLSNTTFFYLQNRWTC
jgi:hypothetical protein